MAQHAQNPMDTQKIRNLFPSGVAYTCCGQMSKGRAYTLYTYTCGGQMSKGRAYTLFTSTCGEQMSKGRAYLLPWEPSATPGSLWYPLNPLGRVKLP